MLQTSQEGVGVEGSVSVGVDGGEDNDDDDDRGGGKRK